MTKIKNLLCVLILLSSNFIAINVNANEPLFSASTAIDIGAEYLKEQNINLKGTSYLSLIEFRPNYSEPKKSYWFLKWKRINPLVKGGWFGLNINNDKTVIPIYGK